MKESNALAQKVKQLRIANNLTQSDVARELNVSPGFISNVENGRTAMSLRLLIYYAKMTGTTLDMLVGDMIPEYRDDALDNAVLEAIKSLSAAQNSGDPEGIKRRNRHTDSSLHFLCRLFNHDI